MPQRNPETEKQNYLEILNNWVNNKISRKNSLLQCKMYTLKMSENYPHFGINYRYFGYTFNCF